MLIKQHTGLHLHQLRQSAATHLGEAGADAAVITAKTHHHSIRTVARCTKPCITAVTAATSGWVSVPRSQAQPGTSGSDASSRILADTSPPPRPLP